MKKEVSPGIFIAVIVILVAVIGFFVYRGSVTPDIPASKIKAPPPPSGSIAPH